MVVATLEEELRQWDRNRLGGTAAGPIDFARALASSPLEWLPPLARIVLRAGSSPIIGLAGSYDEKVAARFTFAVQEVADAVGRTRFITHDEVGHLAKTLGEEIRKAADMYSRPFEMIAVPRGGFFVQGHLSYLLPDLVFGFQQPGRPLLLVDDAAYSGRRLTQWIERFTDREILIATLLSPLEVREAILERYGARVRWLNAEDIRTFGELSPHADETDRPPWRGLTEHCCFPWTEPDRGLRLHGTGEIFTAFRIIPPARCLKNRVQFDSNQGRVRIVGGETGSVRTAPGVLWADVDDLVYLADTVSGRSLTLDGTAAVFWMCSLLSRTRSEVLKQSSHHYKVDPSYIQADLDAFLDEMMMEGVLHFYTSK